MSAGTHIADTPAARLARTIRHGLPVLLLILASMLYLGTRYRIAIDDQVDKCLPPYTVFLVDRHDDAIARDGLYAFPAGERMAPFFPMQMQVVKRVVGLPGDTVSVTAQTTRVEGRTVGEGLDLAGTLGAPAAQFVRVVVVPADAVWIMGATRDSFDSRYWGPLPRQQIIGRAYALF
ncbi:signal peptidase I [Thiocapsa rosea]|uniref:Signal peptidase I n=1 Tax=Thiocapsa rosea TaxID=69360 RepID=A0A495V883_9GAMM|nr:signal peptidase I [Thiocapsa rosea]RKT45622.1 conjugal transfer pilin signal peptidase TrbI [Thiocapsa rosea]